MAGYLSDQIDSTKGVKVHISDASGAQITSFGSSTADGSAFTAGTTTGQIADGVYESTPTTVSDNKAAAIGIDNKRNVKATLATQIAGEDLTNDVLKTEVRGSIAYQAAAAANVVVKSSGGFLYGIILGTWVTGATLEVSDHASDGDGNVKIFLTGDSTASVNHEYPKYIPVNASFSAGITADIVAFTNVTFIYR